MLRYFYAGALWAMERKLRKSNPAVSDKIHAFRETLERAMGPGASLAASVVGPALLWTSKREERRLERGQTYEPPTFVERTNWGAVPQTAPAGKLTEAVA